MRQTKKTTKTTRATATRKRPASTAKRAASTTKRVVSTAKRAAAPRVKKTSKTPFKKKELNKYRDLLSIEQDRLKVELQEIEERAARALEIEASGELSGYDDHPADVASETFEREKDLAIADHVSSLLSKVQNALAKIDKGTYGVCDICRRQIKRARLNAIPFATLCIECQGRVEAR